MTMLEENLNSIRALHPELWELLKVIKPVSYRSEVSRSGVPTLIYQHGGQEYYIHSRFDPVREAVKLTQKHDLSVNHVILLGLGLGYQLEIVMSQKEPGTRVLVIEPEIEILYHSLQRVNWVPLFSRPDFFYFFGRDVRLLAATVEKFIDLVTFERYEIVELASEARFLASYFHGVRELIDSETRSLLYDFKTRLAEDALVPRNILKNSAGILRSRPVRSIKNHFAGRPGFIVSAGPSLDKNVLQLKKIGDRAIIISVDTALKPLLKWGIQPHFTVTADPSFKNYLHLQGTEKQLRYFLVAETGISSQVYRDFGPQIFSVSLGKPMVRMLEENIGEIGEIEAWGSVISLAVNFALYLGLGPVVFLGQDFAFTQMRNHCRGTSWEDDWIEYHQDLGILQRSEKGSITGNVQVSEVRDIYGQLTMTSDRLLLYKNYLAKIVMGRGVDLFINASEGGIFTGIPHRPLYQVIREYVFPAPVLDIAGLFEVPVMENQRNKRQLEIFFNGKLVFFKKYSHKIDIFLQGAGAGLDLPPLTLESLIVKAEELKNQLYANRQNGDIVEMWSQGPIFDFLKRSGKLKKKGVKAMEMVGLYLDYFKRLKNLLENIISSLEESIRRLREERRVADETSRL